MAESLFTTQAPSAADQSDGGPGITTATSLTFATNGWVTGIRFYATATVSAATYTAELWAQTSPDDVAATGSRVGVKVMTSYTPTAGAWNVITFDTPVAVTAGTVYRPAVHNPARYVATNGVFTAASITNGSITAPQASAATRNGTFRIGASANVYPSTAGADANYFIDVVFVTSLTTRRRRTVATYARGTEGRLNDILTVLGTTKPALWPFWESTGILVTDITAGSLIPSETAAAAEQLEDDFSPVMLPCGLFSYHFDPVGDHHLAGTDRAQYSFGDGSVDSPFSVGAWIRPNGITTNVIMGKYDSAGNLEEWRFFIDSSGLLSLELHDASASATEIAVSSAAMTAGQWVFVVATYDGGETAPVVNLYVDGVLVNDGATTETGTYTAMENTAAPLTIACSGVTATPVAEFHGRIALPFITGKALTAAEVTTLYGYTAPMVGIS